MAILEQILEEAKKLPPEEQRRLRAALNALGSNGDTQPAYRTNEQERGLTLTATSTSVSGWLLMVII
jgi:hypothetical protein